MAPGPETKLVARIMGAIRARYPAAFVEKIHGGPYQRAGLPDLFVVVDGQAVGLEVKAQEPGESESAARGRATLRQKAALLDLREAGAGAGVVLSPEEALDVIADALDPQGRQPSLFSLDSKS